MKAVFVRRKRLGYESTLGMAQYIGNCGVLLNLDMKDSDFDDVDVVIRWGCTSTIPIKKGVINTAKAIHLVSDKSRFRAILDEHGLCPKTWLSMEDYVDSLNLNWDSRNLLEVPVIIRPATHSQGRDLHYCTTLHEALDAFEQCGEGAYINEYVRKVSEYRAHVIQGRVSTLEEKIPEDPESIAWNQHQGNTFKNVRWDQWPLDAVKKSIAAMDLAGLDFGGVDVVVDATGKAYVLEINSAPSVPMIMDGDRKGEPSYNQVSFAKCLKHMIENGKGNIPIPESGDNYRRYIHPAITDRAEL